MQKHQLLRSDLDQVHVKPVDWAACGPLQCCMGRSPWRVAVASMLLCRTKRVQAQPTLQWLLDMYPVAPLLARAEPLTLAELVRPCGLHHNRARQLIRFSGQYLSSHWADMSTLTGVSVYIADAIALFCFGRTELYSSDEVLRKYAEQLEAVA
jgi:endonuclease III